MRHTVRYRNTQFLYLLNILIEKWSLSVWGLCRTWFLFCQGVFLFKKKTKKKTVFEVTGMFGLICFNILHETSHPTGNSSPTSYSTQSGPDWLFHFCLKSSSHLPWFKFLKVNWFFLSIPTKSLESCLFSLFILIGFLSSMQTLIFMLAPPRVSKKQNQNPIFQISIHSANTRLIIWISTCYQLQLGYHASGHPSLTDLAPLHLLFLPHFLIQPP